MSYGWLLALGAALAWGSADYLAGRAAMRVSVWQVLGISMATGTLLAGAVSGIPGVTGLTDTPPAPLVWWSVVAGIAEVGGYAGLYHALASGPLGVASSIAGMGVVVPVTAGVVAGQGLSTVQGAGIGTAALGVFLLGWTGRSRIELNCTLSAGLSAACFGVSTLALAKAAQFHPWAAVTMMRTTSLLALIPVGLVLWWRRSRSVAPAALQLCRDSELAHATAFARSSPVFRPGLLLPLCVAVGFSMYPERSRSRPPPPPFHCPLPR